MTEHLTVVETSGPGFRATCTCDWESVYRRPRRAVSESDAREHARIIRIGNDKARAARAAIADERYRQLTNGKWEALAQADQHVTRCTCGTQTWDGDCPTCNTVRIRNNRRKTSA